MMTEKGRIKLRTKALGDGKQSLYLDYMKGGKRIREALHLYITPDATGKLSASDKRTMRRAEAVMAERTKELEMYDHGFAAPEAKSRKQLVDVIDEYRAYLLEKGVVSTAKNVTVVRNAVVRFRGDRTVLADVDDDYCNGFIDFLLDGFTNRRGKTVTINTAEALIFIFSSVLSKAVSEGLIHAHPLKFIKVSDRIRKTNIRKVFLTEEEVRRLMDTQCPCLVRPHVKMSFLFACFTGLSLGDVAALRWKDIRSANDKDYVEQYSRGNSVPLSEAASRWLPDVESRRGVVFTGLPSKTRIGQILRQWADNAGIGKNVSFQTARNTFAYLLLSSGSDINTVAELLGLNSKTARYHLQGYIDMMKQ